jgi:ribosomal protein S6--L-glutamate ligase
MRIAVFPRLDFEDTRIRLDAEAKSLGIELTWIKYKELSVRGVDIVWQGKSLADFDGWYFRAVGSELEWSKLLQLFARKHNIKVVDDYLLSEGPLRRFKSVMSWQLADAGINYAESVFVEDFENLKQAVSEFGYPVIVKLSSGGRHGMGTFLIQGEVDLTEMQIRLSQRNDLRREHGKDEINYRGFLVQEYIENDGDFRVMTVGYKCVGGFKRQPKIEKLILNRSQGGSEGLVEIPADVAREAEKGARVLGVEIAGTDLVRDKKTGKVYVIEVNEAPQFKVFEKRTGINVARIIVEHLVDKFK